MTDRRVSSSGNHRSATRSSRRGTLKAWLQSHGETAGDSLRRLWRQPLGSLMTITVLGIALLLPSLLLVGVNAAASLGSELRDSSEISIYLRDGISEAEAVELQQSLQADPRVATASYMSPQQAAREFARYSGFGDVISALPENPLPGTLQLGAATTDDAALAALLSELEALPQADQVQLDLAWAQRLNAILELSRRLAIALGLIIGVAVLFIIGNTIRLAIEGRREEIMIVKLVGGTDSFVARPFLYTGFWYGLGGGLLACLLLAVLLALVGGPLSRLAGLYHGGELPGLPLQAMAGLLLSATALGWLGALVSVRQHLSAIEPR